MPFKCLVEVFLDWIAFWVLFTPGTIHIFFSPVPFVAFDLDGLFSGLKLKTSQLM